MHFRELSARVLLGASTFLLACDGGGGGRDDDGAGGSSGAPVPAGASAGAVGIGSYAGFTVTTGDLPRATFAVNSPEGALFGTVALSFTIDGEIVAQYTAHNGETASYRSRFTVAEASGEVGFRAVLEAAGRSLETTIVFAAGAVPEDGAGWVRSAWLASPIAPGATAPPSGGVRFDPAGEKAVLPLVDGGQEVSSEAQVDAWIEQAGLAPLAAHPGSRYLMAAIHDVNLIDALDARFAQGAGPAGGAADAGVGRAGLSLHVSPVCGLVGEIVQTDANRLRRETCGQCLAGGAAYTFYLDFLYALACDRCSVSIGLGLEHLLACARARGEAWTDQRCQAEFPAPPPGYVVLATEDGHGCGQLCDEAACQAACAAVVRPQGATFSSGCGPEGCSCLADHQAYCAAQHGAALCGSVALAFHVFCDAAVCGDGRVMTECPANPANAEVCDSTAVSPGCPAGRRCGADCRSCVDPCQCDPAVEPSGCPSDQRCNRNCTCEPRPLEPCPEDTRDSPRRCDPAAGPAACPQGTVCDPGDCECTYCGDDAINGAETCEEGVVGLECSGERACVGCQCQENCGNGRVDPGEHCDSPTGEGCDAGFVCRSCTCVENQAVCGDGLCDRVGGESETACPGDCPVACGDGRCNVNAGESFATCPGDCPASSVDCCVQTNGCPSEELYSCPGDCCCCPSGAHCVQSSGVWVCGI